MSHDIGIALTTCRVGLHSWSSPSLAVDDVVRRTCRQCDKVDLSPRRPRSIRTAWALLIAIVALGLIHTVIALIARQRFIPAAVEFRSPNPQIRDRVVTELSSSLSYAVLSGVLAAVALIPLVIALRRPRHRARIAAWIALAGYLIVQAVFLSANPTSAAEPHPSAVGLHRQRWDNLVPDWYAPATHLIETPLILATVAVLILLLFDSSREYFTRRHQVAADDPRIWTITRRADRDGSSPHSRLAGRSTP